MGTSPPSGKPAGICCVSGGEQRGKRTSPHLLTCFYPAKQKDSPVDCPFSLPLVTGIMHAQFKHGYQKRVALDLACILGKAMCFVQSVTISAPIDEVFLRRVFAFLLDLFQLKSDFSDNGFLTFSHLVTPPSGKICPPFSARFPGLRWRPPPAACSAALDPCAASIGRRSARFFAHSVPAGCPALFFAATMRRL